MVSVKRSLSSRLDGNGKSEILLRVIVCHGNSMRMKSGVFVKPDRFGKDGRINKPYKKGLEYEELKSAESMLTGLENFIVDTIQREENPEGITKPWLMERVDRYRHPKKYEEKAERKSFLDYFDEHLEKHSFSEARMVRYRVLRSDLERFEAFMRVSQDPGYVLDINTFDEKDIERFVAFLTIEYELPAKFPTIYKDVAPGKLPKPRGKNTIAGLLKALRAFFNWLYRQKYTTNRPFDKYEGHVSETYGTPIYISLEERNRIADFDLSEYPQLAVQRDVFVFQCLIGCRVSDLMKLRPSNIVDGAIEYIPRKTEGKRPFVVRVPLNARAKTLVERYRDVDRKGRLLPFITIEKYNNDIKRIFKLCGITRLVTVVDSTTGDPKQVPICDVASSHMARRTFVGNLYKQVKDPNLIDKLSGHSENSRAFARYRDIDEDMKRDLVRLID
jgi:integrase